MTFPSCFSFRRAVRAPNRRGLLARSLRLEAFEDRCLLSVNFGSTFSIPSPVVSQGWSVTTDGAGDRYVAGNFSGTLNPGSGVPALTSVGASDAFAAKYDASGNCLWATDLGFAAGSQAGAAQIALDGSGNVYISGGWQSSTSSLPTTMFVAKLNGGNGQVAWQQNVETDPGSASINDFTINPGFAVDAAGNVYLDGRFNNTVQKTWYVGPYTLTGGNNDQTFVTKLDTNGNYQWIKTTSGISTTEPGGLAVDASGSVYITGSFVHTTNFNPAGTYDLSSIPQGKNYYFDAYVWKLDTNGNFVWADGMGSDATDKGVSIAVDPTGNVYVTGTWGDGGVKSAKSTDFDPGPGVYQLPYTGGTTRETFLEKLNNAGQFIWAETTTGQGGATPVQLALDGAGNAYLIGHFSSAIGFGPNGGQVTLTPAGPDYYAWKATSTGGLDWAIDAGFYQSSGQVFLHGIAIDASNNVDLLGAFRGTVDFDPGPGTYYLTSAGANNGINGFVTQWTQTSSLQAQISTASLSNPSPTTFGSPATTAQPTQSVSSSLSANPNDDWGSLAVALAKRQPTNSSDATDQLFAELGHAARRELTW